jgi:hypothetical protein
LTLVLKEENLDPDNLLRHDAPPTNSPAPGEGGADRWLLHFAAQRDVGVNPPNALLQDGHVLGMFDPSRTAHLPDLGEGSMLVPPDTCGTS